MPAAPLIGVDFEAVRIRVFGRVQGLGVRPAVARLAARCQVGGQVANTADGLAIELEGRPAAVREFLNRFDDSLPAGTRVERREAEPIAAAGRREFQIVSGNEAGRGAAAVPLDRVACAACLAEVRSSENRRRGHAFNGCTQCGPRYSIIDRMPYERPATTMRGFAQCPACRDEYADAADRRFHAQTNACAQCGPQVRLVDAAGRSVGPDEAVAAAATALRAGKIVALKGLGGYQLLVDAASPEAVRRLRQRKRRPTKPLAVLVNSIENAERLADLDAAERRLLRDPAGPIVVVRRRANAPLAADIAPEFQSVGLLLPTTPLHAMLCDLVATPLVCTSGNLEGSPLVYDERSAERELAEVADVWLHHDRPIRRPIDDSVVRVIAGRPCFLRLGRGYAPHVLATDSRFGDTPILAVGGEQKGAIALFNGAQAVLGPHVGDLSDAATWQRWVEQTAALAELYGVDPEAAEIVRDLHPDYLSTRWADGFPRRQAVQHHHAHIAAILLEHEEFDREVLGLAWDGTGYGDDGTVWGGECLQATMSDYRRTFYLRPFPLVGGEQAIRQPWRVGAVLTREVCGHEQAAAGGVDGVTPQHLRACLEVAARPGLSPLTSSMGRLFDGVASLVLGVTSAGDDGRPAMLLEEACDPTASGSYAFIVPEAGGQIDWRPVVRDVIADVRRGEPPGAVAMRFHRAVADLAAAVGRRHPHLPLVTSGGVFQNRILGELLAERLSARAGGWLRPMTVPPGDGGLAAGQMAVAAARMKMSRSRKERPCV